MASECSAALGGTVNASSGPSGNPSNGADSGQPAGADAGVGDVDAGAFDAGFMMPPLDGGPPP